jgi:hypothetical protein
MTLTEAREHVGDGVIYRPPFGTPEPGVISSVGTKYVFVRYGSDQFGKSTDPAALTLATPEVLPS